MKTEEMRELHAAGASEASRSAVTAREEANHRFRLLATMVQGTAAALPEAWQSYPNVEHETSNLEAADSSPTGTFARDSHCESFISRSRSVRSRLFFVTLQPHIERSPIRVNGHAAGAERLFFAHVDGIHRMYLPNGDPLR
jgi:hypothetical protein